MDIVAGPFPVNSLVSPGPKGHIYEFMNIVKACTPAELPFALGQVKSSRSSFFMAKRWCCRNYGKIIVLSKGELTRLMLHLRKALLTAVRLLVITVCSS